MSSGDMSLEIVAAVEATLWLRAERTNYSLVPVNARDMSVQRIQTLEALVAIDFGTNEHFQRLRGGGGRAVRVGGGS